jgi:hypothetical protein
VSFDSFGSFEEGSEADFGLQLYMDGVRAFIDRITQGS